MFHPNQNVTISTASDGGLLVTSRQNTSTPGIYQRFLLKPNCEYNIHAVGANLSKKKCQLWIGDASRETLFLSSDSLNSKLGELHYKFYNHTRTIIHVGVLFDVPEVGDSFILYKLTVKLIRERVTNTVGPPPKLNSYEQRQTRLALERVYDKYWTYILKIIRGSGRETGTSSDLERVWFTILEYEYRETRRDFIYSQGKQYEYNDPNDFIRAIHFSRKPLLDGLEMFEPDVVLEAGAGWGRNLYYMFMVLAGKQKNKHQDVEYYGLELTAAGIQAMEEMKKFIPVGCEYKLTTGEIDFDVPAYPEEIRGKRIMFFTTWSLKEITYLNKMLFYKLLELSENILGIHLEPIGWQITGEGDPHMHFNRNMYGLLKELEGEGRIRITHVEPEYIGFFSRANTASLIIWQSVLA